MTDLGCRHSWPCLSSRRVEADRRVLTRHGTSWDGHFCIWCVEAAYGQEAVRHPCPDLLDLAARLDVETSR